MVITDKTKAIIVAIEKYRFSSDRNQINNVDYAQNDAFAFKKLLMEEFGVPEKDITVLLDGEATKTWFENELPYEIKNLKEDEKFIFYYAGHGFHQSGTNRLTTWDTHTANLNDTTISLKEVLLDPLEESDCKKSLIFIDACAIKLPKTVSARDLISNMDKSEFLSFVKASSYRAVFTSCSPGEKSYPSSTLQHGIWTWHLIEALSGRAEDAIARDNCITDASLRDYLKYAVPRYITKNMNISAKQTPYAVVSASGSFEVRIIPEEENDSADLPKLELEYDKYFLRGHSTERISSLSDFNKKRGHFVPDDANEAADNFVKRLLDEDLRNELKEIYDSAKKILNLRRKNIEKSIWEGSGSVETEHFRYFIDVGQDPNNFAQALTTRRVILRSKSFELPENFDDIFPASLDEIVIPVSGSIDFDELVEGFENAEEVLGGNVEEDDEEGIIKYTNEDKSLALYMHTYDQELVICPKGNRGCLDLIEKAEEGLKEITGTQKKLLK